MNLALEERCAALESALDAGDGRLPREVADRGRAVLAHVAARAGLSAEHTVVALAGATGSGKSSVFNALVGTPLAGTGVQRPTTAHALAAVWGAGAQPLLDWLGVQDRRDMGQGAGAPARLRHGAGPGRRGRPVPANDIPTGLVLLDLPDHDSVVDEHRVRAERLVERADLLVWVVDPQKYADAALHERYLRPLARHADVTVLVLNQIDRLEADQTHAVLADLRRLAAQDGLDDVRALAVSARTGEGIDELRGLLGQAAARRHAATARLAADVRAAADPVLAACEPDRAGPGRVADATVGRLLAALEGAAGVEEVTAAVRRSAVRRAAAHTGWPPVRWLARLRPDPLRRLHLGPRAATGTGGGADADRDLTPTSLPPVGATGTARTANAVRGYVDEALAGVPVAWTLVARERVGVAGLADELDRAVAGTLVLPARPARWWRVMGMAQWLLLATAAAGLLWLAALALAGYLRLPEPGTPMWGPIPAPSALLMGGVAAGLLLALLGMPLTRFAGRRQARAARRRLSAAVAAVAQRRVVEPLAAELTALQTCRDQAARAASRR